MRVCYTRDERRVDGGKAGRQSIRNSTLILSAAFLGMALIATPASGAWVEVTGGKLASSGPPFNFAPKAVGVLVSGLSAGWSTGAGCHTVNFKNHPWVKFGFRDGLTDGAKLIAAGFTLDLGRGSPPPFDGSSTFITFCRDKSGKLASFTVQLAYYRLRGGAVDVYSVFAQNTSPVSGSSNVEEGSLEGSHAISATAYSKAVNRLQLSQ